MQLETPGEKRRGEEKEGKGRRGKNKMGREGKGERGREEENREGREEGRGEEFTNDISYADSKNSVFSTVTPSYDIIILLKLCIDFPFPSAIYI